ncbi:formate dehydrogenase, alpha subunit [Streptomyces azureus]|uniref:Formate dehydrogenase, alpha subunit n=1 Tax=Streptomyces azureus TaxID=146537 RepID=A0A0K8PPQ0_STRAJ|nr:formate dehydrogenase, alpha subunit [Streptomyces azureus]
MSVRGPDSAGSGDRRIRPKAGTEVPLAHAIGREIIRAGLADHAFIERATTGFEEYQQLVEPWTLSLAEKVTGISAVVIRELAHGHAPGDQGRPRTPFVVEHHHGTDTGRALSNLALLTGTTTERDLRAAFRLVSYDPPVDLTDEWYPIRLTTGRRLDSYKTVVQKSGSASPLRRGTCIELSPEDAERYGVVVGEEVRVSTRRGSVTAPVWVDPTLRAGLAFTTMRLSDAADLGAPPVTASCPIPGTAEFEAAAVRIEKLPVAAVRS